MTNNQNNIASNPSTVNRFGIESDITWNDFINDYVLPRVRPQPAPASSFSSVELKALVSKYDSKSLKTDEEKAQEEKEWASAGFSGRVLSTTKNSFDIVEASAHILGKLLKASACTGKLNPGVLKPAMAISEWNFSISKAILLISSSNLSR